MIIFTIFQGNYGQENRSGRHPNHTVTSASARDCLKTQLVEPVVSLGFNVQAVRITWKSPNDMETIWARITEIQNSLDAAVNTIRGVKMVISTINGLYTHTLKAGELPKNVRPAIAYWIVHDNCDPNVAMQAIRQGTAEFHWTEVDVRAIYRESLVTVKDCCSALFSAMKDYNSRWVSNKVEMSLGTLQDGCVCKMYVHDESLQAIGQLFENHKTIAMSVTM